jgi:charged multivesicular body protein 2A
MGLEQQEKKTVIEIKKMAKEGQMASVKVMAKSLVRNRKAITKMHGLKSQLQAVSLRMATLKSTQAMADAMQGATKAMRIMNKRLNMPQLQKIMREFEMQNEKMEMTGEMMGDAIDDAMGDEDEEEESDALISQVLDEIGISLNEIASAPKGKIGVQSTVQEAPQAEALGAGSEGINDDLQARLDKLRKS